MTIAEAKQALSEGKKITHRFWMEGEWAIQTGQYICFDDDVCVHIKDFWHFRSGEFFQTGWAIFTQQIKTA